MLCRVWDMLQPQATFREMRRALRACWAAPLVLAAVVEGFNAPFVSRPAHAARAGPAGKELPTLILQQLSMTSLYC